MVTDVNVYLPALSLLDIVTPAQVAHSTQSDNDLTHLIRNDIWFQLMDLKSYRPALFSPLYSISYTAHSWKKTPTISVCTQIDIFCDAVTSTVSQINFRRVHHYKRIKLQSFMNNAVALINSEIGIRCVMETKAPELIRQ